MDSVSIDSLSKLEQRFLREMWKHRHSEFGRAIEWRGKYYWGYYEVGSSPIGTKTLDRLVAKGLVEKCFGEYRLKRKEVGSDQYVASIYFGVAYEQ